MNLVQTQGTAEAAARATVDAIAKSRQGRQQVDEEHWKRIGEVGEEFSEVPVIDTDVEEGRPKRLTGARATFPQEFEASWSLSGHELLGDRLNDGGIDVEQVLGSLFALRLLAQRSGRRSAEGNRRTIDLSRFEEAPSANQTLDAANEYCRILATDIQLKAALATERVVDVATLSLAMLRASSGPHGNAIRRHQWFGSSMSAGLAWFADWCHVVAQGHIDHYVATASDALARFVIGCRRDDELDAIAKHSIHRTLFHGGCMCERRNCYQHHDALAYLIGEDHRHMGVRSFFQRAILGNEKTRVLTRMAPGNASVQVKREADVFKWKSLPAGLYAEVVRRETGHKLLERPIGKILRVVEIDATRAAEVFGPIKPWLLKLPDNAAESEYWSRISAYACRYCDHDVRGEYDSLDPRELSLCPNCWRSDWRSQRPNHFFVLVARVRPRPERVAAFQARQSAHRTQEVQR